MESRTIYRVFSKSGAVILRKYEILAILLEVDTIFSFYDQNDKIPSQPEHIRKSILSNGIRIGLVRNFNGTLCNSWIRSKDWNKSGWKIVIKNQRNENGYHFFDQN